LAARPVWPAGRVLAVLTLLAGGAVPLTSARAQYIQSYFPTGIPGYEGQAGITVLSRSRSLYDPEDIHLDGFDIRPRLTESIDYSSDVEGIAGSPGSVIIETAPSLEISSDWARNELGFSVSADDQRYLSLPGDNSTSWSAGAGGSYTLGRGAFTLGLAYLSEHQLGSEFGALVTTTPVAYHVIDTRLSYGLSTGRFTFTPNVDFTQVDYSSAVVNGVTESQGYRDTQTLLGGLTTRFDLGGERSLLLVLQGVQVRYPDIPRGGLNNGSTGVIGLVGLDYQTSGVFRYRLLAGLETRSFAAAVFGSQTAPIAEASVIWTPTGLTTVTDTLSREIESPASTDTGDFTYTVDSLVIDHELRRNILLQGRVSAQLAEYLHQSDQTSLTFGGGFTWLISKRFRLIGDFTSSRTSGQPSGLSSLVSRLPGGERTPISGNFTENRLMLTLRVTP
jgi:hypothetical protein